MENNSHIKKEYGMISPHDLVRATEHFESFFSPEETQHIGTIESYQKFDRLKPVYYVSRIEGDKTINAVIDGWKYVVFAQQTGIEKIYCCQLSVESSEDLVSIMIQLQRSNHDSFMALFKMIEQLWPLHSKGKGFRSDLYTAEENIDSEENQNLNVYERIGRDLNISGTKVKHIRKVGQVNSDHFEKIENSRFTLYAAYLECVKDENGEKPEPPNVQQPTYYTTATVTPEFVAPTITSEIPANINVENSNNSENQGTPEIPQDNGIDTSSAIPEADTDFITVSGICQCCNQRTQVKIKRKDIL